MTPTHHHPAAVVDGAPVWPHEIDARLARMRAADGGDRLPDPSSAEGRQLRRWTTQVVVLERLFEAAAAGLPPGVAGPAIRQVVPDGVAAVELGSMTTAALTRSEAGRRVYAHVASAYPGGHAKRRAFLDWLAPRLHRVELGPGYEHPADPRQPDAEHRH
ncbi:hypothetical protein ACFO1B_14375 [Dactylosporangium siamense]|uniref:Malonyl CoA-ACP transacylase n=1 Tax=Dactylosporangium siamense TaxID=685454 RepID=A0A919PMW3_9ACTN|nr:hypothetical protein [Dactylosporangium siamense]GIG45018.1 hypothetical protein Dsi01nite_030590 [Dactylosporangium siamense]